jgi:outer membrane protein OmpA-like peptidoglycan-associated protein
MPQSSLSRISRATVAILVAAGLPALITGARASAAEPTGSAASAPAPVVVRASPGPAGAVAATDRDLGAAEPIPPSATGQASLAGPIGLFETSTAEVGTVHQLRIGLHGEYFSASSFLIGGDSDQRLRGGLVLGYTPLPRFELFGAMLSSSNRNERLREPGDRDPTLVKSFGDLVLGAKAAHRLSAAATVGLEVGVKLLAGVSQLSLSFGSTSLWLGPVLTYDLRSIRPELPLRFHGSVSYYLDNSSNLHDLASVTRNTKEAMMFGYGIAGSRIRLALAADAPLPSGVLPIALDPFVEYHVEVVTGTADATFADYTGPTCGTAAGAHPCVDNRDMHWLTFGARAAVYRSLVAGVGVDVRVRSVGFPYGTPLPPYNVLFGLSLPLDLGALSRPAVAARPVETPVPPKDGYLTGTVRSSQGASPIGGAIVSVVGRQHSRAATDVDGGFTTSSLPPGPVELEVTAPTFEPLEVVTTVVAGEPQNLTVTLRAQVPTAALHGRVTSREGSGLEATLKVTGRGKTDGLLEAHSDGTGRYALALPVGAYRVRAAALGLPAREAEIEVGPGEDRNLDFTLRPAPASPDVQLAGEWIKLRRNLRFEGDSARLTPPTAKMLDAVAELLEAHGELRHIQISAHWDASLPRTEADVLTQQQADAVKAYLVARGVAADRLTTAGMGSTRPLVPNLTPANRLRNRRVEFHLE